MKNIIKEFEFREEMYNYIIPKNKIGCEIGVCRGFNAINLYHSSKPNILHLVDLWEINDNKLKNFQMVKPYIKDDFTELVKHIFEDEIKENKVKLWQMDSTNFLSILEDNHLDWVYLDSCHLYNHIKNEINLCLRKVKTGGLIMGHDFHPGDDQRSGVIRAVIETIQNNQMKMIAISSEKYASWVCEIL